MKAIITSILILFSCNVFCVDYSIEKNSNPYAKYAYNPNQNINYIDNTIANPIKSITPQKTQETNIQFNHIQNNSHTCWDAAAKLYDIDPWLLFAYAYVESRFNPKAIHKNAVKNPNTQASYDIGLMQINSTWLKTLKKYGIELNHLFDPCVSIHVGAWIAKQNIKHYGLNIDGIGAYNSPFNVKQRRFYGQQVINAYVMLVNKYKKY